MWTLFLCANVPRREVHDAHQARRDDIRAENNEATCQCKMVHVKWNMLYVCEWGGEACGVCLPCDLPCDLWNMLYVCDLPCDLGGLPCDLRCDSSVAPDLHRGGLWQHIARPSGTQPQN